MYHGSQCCHKVWMDSNEIVGEIENSSCICSCVKKISKKKCHNFGNFWPIAKKVIACMYVHVCYFDSVVHYTWYVNNVRQIKLILIHPEPRPTPESLKRLLRYDYDTLYKFE